jgi:hypothetical protein
MSETRKPNDLFDAPNMIQICPSSKNQRHKPPKGGWIQEQSCALRPGTCLSYWTSSIWQISSSDLVVFSRSTTITAYRRFVCLFSLVGYCVVIGHCTFLFVVRHHRITVSCLK